MWSILRRWFARRDRVLVTELVWRFDPVRETSPVVTGWEWDRRPTERPEK